MERSSTTWRILPDSLEAQKTTEQPLTLEEAFRRYSPYVAAVALRILGRDDEVDDIVQNVFIEAMKSLSSLREPAAVKGWLATITVRVTRRRLRWRKVKTFLGLEKIANYEQLVAKQASPEDSALLKSVYQLLDHVPVEQRLAWALRHVEGEQLEMVAELCGCSLATAKRRIAATQTYLEGALRDV
jgi:RNA polymerase sigma-70 factor, ECF subfamily